MTDFTGIIVVITAIACMILAQRASSPKPTRRLYSIFGSATCVLVAIEAAHRHEPGVMFLFAAAATLSLFGVAIDYIKAAKS